MKLLMASIVLAMSALCASSNGFAFTAQEDLIRAGATVNTSFDQKPVKVTNRTWDIAIRGSGFFPLQDTKTGELFYTRLGHFELDHDGYVILGDHPNLRLILKTESQMGPLNMLKWMSMNGHPMVGVFIDDKEEIGEVSVIYSNGRTEEIGTLLLVHFFNEGKLSATAPHIYRAEAAALPRLMAPPSEMYLGGITAKALEQM